MNDKDKITPKLAEDIRNNAIIHISNPIYFLEENRKKAFYQQMAKPMPTFGEYIAKYSERLQTTLKAISCPKAVAEYNKLVAQFNQERIEIARHKDKLALQKYEKWFEEIIWNDKILTSRT